ncbi:hypothetical protein OH77DRAFT_223241 [Trametes cingulata]|nr:hypothetical protein OH77DRAFT_223241 [Trametes cingulata]
MPLTPTGLQILCGPAAAHEQPISGLYSFHALRVPPPSPSTFVLSFARRAAQPHNQRSHELRVYCPHHVMWPERTLSSSPAAPSPPALARSVQSVPLLCIVPTPILSAAKLGPHPRPTCVCLHASPNPAPPTSAHKLWPRSTRPPASSLLDGLHVPRHRSDALSCSARRKLRASLGQLGVKNGPSGGFCPTNWGCPHAARWRHERGRHLFCPLCLSVLVSSCSWDLAARPHYLASLYSRHLCAPYGTPAPDPPLAHRGLVFTACCGKTSARNVQTPNGALSAA